jgi:hypothetical protein
MGRQLRQISRLSYFRHQGHEGLLTFFPLPTIPTPGIDAGSVYNCTSSSGLLTRSILYQNKDTLHNVLIFLCKRPHSTMTLLSYQNLLHSAQCPHIFMQKATFYHDPGESLLSNQNLLHSEMHFPFEIWIQDTKIF